MQREKGGLLARLRALRGQVTSREAEEAELQAHVAENDCELGIAFVPYSPLGRGFLTGKLAIEDLPDDDNRRQNPRFEAENAARNMELVRRIRTLAEQKNCTAPQLALAWLLAQGDDIISIPGTKKRKYLEENLAALDVTLTAEDLARIDRDLPPGSAAGERYPPAMMEKVGH